ncbi:SNF2-related protein [Microbacterium abyssi]|uniref:DEAD/DEAH box helicase n=1 Tax=Microbacterium abyssi TaxID=2782166 RepID=UPI001889A99E|nr:SNF2-related protein [Microbacterium sp. A18JL241]
MPAPLIDLAILRRVTDAGSLERGRAYARAGMVIRTAWNADFTMLTADVRGSGDADYRCVVRVARGREAAEITSTTCTCPVRLGCKHIVAAILTSNADVDASPVASPAQTSTASAAPTWRVLLDSPPAAGSTAPLALGVEVRHRAARGVHQWAPRPVRTATVRDVVKGGGELLLGIRPLMRSESTGAWIQGAASWDAVRRPGTQFPAEQLRWFAELLSIARDSLLSGTAGDWLILDHVESGLLWPHLRAGAQRGIPLITAQKSFSVAFAESGEVTAAIERTDDGLSVAADVVLDGHPVDAETVWTIGHSGVYAVATLGARAQVTLAEVPLSSAVHALISARRPLAVPAAEESAFLRDAYPALARRALVRAVGAVELPPVPMPVATLVLVHRPGDRIDYAIEWTYRDHGRFSLAPTADAVRDDSAEQEALQDVATLWEAVTGEGFAASGTLHDVDAAEFATHIVPALKSEGLQVVVTGKPRTYQELSGAPEITVSTVESSDPDWFDLGVIVKIDGRSIPFAPLFTALSMRRTKLLLVDGSYFSLAHPALDSLRELIDEATELAEWETGPRISRYQTDLWEEFEDLADEAVPATGWRATAEGLREANGVPTAPLPAELQAELRPYQKAGFDWLAFLWGHRLGGILADDMGLGKTIQLLTLMLHARETGEQRPFLVIAPTSVLSTWSEEAARFAPSLRVRVVEGTRTRRDGSIADAARDADVVVTSYTLARLEAEEYAAARWAVLVLDEAQFVKNPATKLHRAVASIPADVTFAVTGTPMENSLGDLWALLKLTAPGLFASARKFRQDYIQPIEQGKVPENEEGGEYRQRRLERLRRRIRPLMLRRTKELVATDLPEKQEQLLHVELSPAHRALYDIVLQRERQKVLGLLQDLDRNRFIVFRSLTMLRMLSLAPGLVDEDDAKIGSRKLDTLVDRVSELRAEGHRALVFSQFTSFLQLAAERLEQAGIAYAYLDGSTRRRKEVIDGFRTGEQPVFLISLKSGGFGLTLTEADYVFMLDPWWNPAADAQAVDRTHRIGQRNRVFVYRMISSGTIEEKVLALQQRKARLFTAVMDDEALFAQSLTAEDIRGLFDA